MSKRKNKDEINEEITNLNSAPQDEAAKHELEKKQRELKRKLRELRKSEEEKTQQLIFSNTEFETTVDFIEKKERQPIEFPDGRTTSIAELKEITKMLMAEPRVYKSIFGEQLYDEMRRLTGYKKDKDNPHHRPNIFSIYTIKYAYGRFNLKELIRVLQDRNPFLAGLNVRGFKHFQLIDDEHYLQLKGFLEDMKAVMKTCKDGQWYKFEKKYSDMYHLAFPDDLFDY